MGYTHYWRRKQELSEVLFTRAALDCAAVARALKAPIAGGAGDKAPVFDFEMVYFNGVRDCGHPERHLGIAWPDDEAEGIADYDEDITADGWFGGAKIKKRACDGDCSHESFWIPRVAPDELNVLNEKDGKVFQFCKTAFKPYDLLTQCCLIVFSHHFGEDFLVMSDGKSGQWNESRATCQSILGYGKDFELYQPPQEKT